MAALLKLQTLRNSISGMGKRFYGIWSEEVRQTIEKAIEEKMEKIVQLGDKVHQQKAMNEINMDFAKMIAEQYQKQMAQQNAKMEEFKKEYLAYQLEMEKEFNKDSKNEIEGKLKVLTMASVPIPDISKMANLDQQDKKVCYPEWNRGKQLEEVDFDDEHFRIRTDVDGHLDYGFE